MPTFSFTPPSGTRIVKLTPGQAALVSVLVVIIGLAVTIFFGIPTAKNALESSDWPVVEGIVAISEVSRNSDSDGSITYGAQVSYDYIVDGSKFSGSTVSFGDYSSSDSSHAYGIVARYPVGKNVTISYDPLSPSRAVLEPGAKLSSFVVAIAGILFAIFGAGAFIYNFRKWRNKGITATGPAPQAPSA